MDRCDGANWHDSFSEMSRAGGGWRRSFIRGFVKSWMKQAGKLEEAGRSKCVVVIPLLFETKAESEFDAIVCVACSAETQLRRLKGRGWSEAEIAGRLGAQWPIEQKVKLSNYVVWAEGSLEVHGEQVRRIVSRIDGLKPGA